MLRREGNCQLELVSLFPNPPLSPSLPRSVNKIVSLVSAPLGLADRMRELMIRPQFFWSQPPAGSDNLIVSCFWFSHICVHVTSLFGTCTSPQVAFTSGLHVPKWPCAGTGKLARLSGEMRKCATVGEICWECGRESQLKSQRFESQHWIWNR